VPPQPDPFAEPLAVEWEWRGAGCGAHVSFSGRGAGGSRQEVLSRLTGETRPIAWVRQVHAARVVAAAPGECGEGDGLVARDGAVALSIVTADCVPVLLAGPRGIAAAHAGWRGIVAGIVPATLTALGGAPGGCAAWIGPAIGACCYETGPDVAARLVEASDVSVISPGPAGRPHVDLRGAVRHQLEALGVTRIEMLSLCTRCASDRLHSYRREGPGGGRNHSFIWLQ
jgi:polyphenol oxidase